MPYRSLLRFAPMLAVILAAAPAVRADDHSHHHQQDSYARDYDYDNGYGRGGAHCDRYSSGRYDRYGHGHRRPALGHALADLFRYGSTDRYSSRRHFYQDEHRARDRYIRDQHRVYDRGRHFHHHDDGAY